MVEMASPSQSPTGSPVRKKRKVAAQPYNSHLIKLLEGAERSDMRVSEEGELCDKELWFFQLPKNASHQFMTQWS